jgi:hypothetical protein
VTLVIWQAACLKYLVVVNFSFQNFKSCAMKKLLLLITIPFMLPAFSQKWAKEYDFVNDFANGASLVKKNGKYGFVNKEGKILVPTIYDEASTMNEGFAPVRQGDAWGYVDSLGKLVIEPKFADALCFRSGLAPVKKVNKWGFIKSDGSFAIEPAYDNARGFHEGVAAVTNTKGYWGYIDRSGKQIIPFMYHFADNFDEGRAKVMKGEKVLYINHNNEVVQEGDNR